MPKPPSFGRLLRELRIQAGASQEELADLAGMHRTYIGLLERDLRQPTLDTLFRLSKALKVRPSAIVAKLEKRYFRPK